MKRLCLFFVFCFFSINAHALTLEPIVSAFAIPADANYSANDWPETNKINNIKWQHKGLRSTPVTPFSRSGKVSLSKLGVADVFFSGARTMVLDLDVSIGEANGHIVEKTAFNQAVKAQFSNSTQIKSVRAGCPDEGAVSGSAVYEITLPRKKSVFMMINTDVGGSTPNSRATLFQFSLKNEDRWACVP